jgi:hypothetical protein
MRRGWREFWMAFRVGYRAARARALRDEAQRALREAKRRYGFPTDAGRES